MSNNIERIILQQDALTTVRFLEFFCGLLLEGRTAAQLAEKADPALTGSSDWANLVRLTLDQRRLKLPAEISVDIARRALQGLAKDPGLCTAMERSWYEYRRLKQDVMFIDPILSVGFVASMLLFVATTEFEGELFGFKVKKTVPPTELVRELAKAAFEALLKVSPNR